MTSIVDHRRRNLILGRPPETSSPVRPPWTKEAILLQACTGCEACATACPEHIVVIDSRGLPRIDFEPGECTFCGACAEACSEPIFVRGRETRHAFAHTVRIGEGCLTLDDVVCRSCGDVCPESAIRFNARLGGPSTPEVDGETCTGCGACIGICPAGAISTQTEAG